MSELPREIRGVMIPVTGGRVLLPNASVAEVITFSTAEPVARAPAWLIGRIGWRGWRLPLFSFSLLAGFATEERSVNARVAVLKALEGHPRMPYIALLTQGFPRLTTISPDILVPTGDGAPLPAGVQEQVLVRDDQAAIPDLAAIEDMIDQALQRAA